MGDWMGDGVGVAPGSEVRPLYEGKHHNDKHMQGSVAQPDDWLRSEMLAVGARQKRQGSKLLPVFIDFAGQSKVQEQGRQRQRSSHAGQTRAAPSCHR
jgi:hypothetical protein